jgi:hypothetical protein
MIAWLERFGPMAIAATAAALLFWQRESVSCAYQNGVISLAELYGAVLDWSAIQTGFLFGIYGYVAGKNDGFVAALKQTGEMRSFVDYMKTATILGFAVTLSSIPMMVFQFGLDGTIAGYSIFVGWSVLSIWAFFAFARVAYLFGILVRTKDRVRVPG